MTKPMVREHNTETDEVTDREMTDDEFAIYEIQQAQAQNEAETLAAKESARQAILDRLGLTQEEAALLLGAN